MNTVFLSASIPLPDRDRKFFDTADVISIREAIKGLVLVILESRTDLVFGGHPAITPLVTMLFQQAGFSPEEHVTLYQSQHFKDKFPEQNQEMTKIVVTEGIDGDREKSLELLRRRMIGDSRYSCGVFIGGMEGVLNEFDLFRETHPNTPVFPIASTGAAASIIYNKYSLNFDLLRTEYTYPTLFRTLFSGLNGIN